MSDIWIPTDAEVDACGDAILEALIAVSGQYAGAAPLPTVGDLVLEVSSGSLDWERVGYLLAPIQSPSTLFTGTPIKVWSVGRRVVRWHNASVRRRGLPGLRLPSFPYPTPAEIGR